MVSGLKLLLEKKLVWNGGMLILGTKRQPWRCPSYQ